MKLITISDALDQAFIGFDYQKADLKNLKILISNQSGIVGWETKTLFKYFDPDLHELDSQLFSEIDTEIKNKGWRISDLGEFTNLKIYEITIVPNQKKKE